MSKSKWGSDTLVKKDVLLNSLPTSPPVGYSLPELDSFGMLMRMLNNGWDIRILGGDSKAIRIEASKGRLRCQIQACENELFHIRINPLNHIIGRIYDVLLRRGWMPSERCEENRG